MADPLFSPPFDSAQGLRQELYRGHGWTITLDDVRLPDGRMKRTSRVHLCDTVDVLALPTDHTVLLLREYRPIWNANVWQIVGGKVDKEKNAAIAAQRELREETGFRAQKMEPYFQCRHWDKVDYICNVFIARDLVPDQLPKDEGESMEVHELPIDEAIQSVLQSPFISTVSLATLLRYAREHG